MAEEKKTWFQKMRDMVSTRDEKEQVEEMEQELEEAEKQVSKMKTDSARKSIQSQAEKQKVAEAEKRAAEAEARAKALEAELRKKRVEEKRAAEKEMREELAARRAEAAKPKYIATHTLTSKETLSHLALEYYGHATPPYWKLIYEANKEVIGDNPNKVRPGLEINIPELPDELKDK